MQITWVRRTRATAVQAGLSNSLRRQNVAGVFRVRRGARVAGMRGLAMAVAIAAAVIGAYGLVPRGGVAAEQAYTTVVRPAVADPWAAQP